MNGLTNLHPFTGGTKFKACLDYVQALLHPPSSPLDRGELVDVPPLRGGAGFNSPLEKGDQGGCNSAEIGGLEFFQPITPEH